MTGVKVLLGRVKVSLDLELIPREDGLTVELREGVVTVMARDVSSSMFSTELEAKVKSSSNSLKSATALATLPAAELAAMAAALLARAAEL